MADEDIAALECGHTNVPQKLCFNCLQPTCTICPPKPPEKKEQEEGEKGKICCFCGKPYPKIHAAALKPPCSLTDGFFSEVGIVCEKCRNRQPLYRFCTQCGKGFKLTCRGAWCWKLEEAWNDKDGLDDFMCFRCRSREEPLGGVIEPCAADEVHVKIWEESCHSDRMKEVRRLRTVPKGPFAIAPNPQCNEAEYRKCSYLQRIFKECIPVLEYLDGTESARLQKKKKQKEEKEREKMKKKGELLPSCLAHPEADGSKDEEPEMELESDVDDGEGSHTAFSMSSDEEELPGLCPCPDSELLWPDDEKEEEEEEEEPDFKLDLRKMDIANAIEELRKLETGEIVDPKNGQIAFSGNNIHVLSRTDPELLEASVMVQTGFNNKVERNFQEAGGLLGGEYTIDKRDAFEEFVVTKRQQE